LIAESKSQMGGPYFRASSGKSVRFPGSLGGPNWGSTAFYPDLNYLIVSSSNLGGASLGGSSANRFKEGKTNMMCQQPPWGTVAAVNVDTADVVCKYRVSGEFQLTPPWVSEIARDSVLSTDKIADSHKQ
jgi:glucose dehydrogenase